MEYWYKDIDWTKIEFCKWCKFKLIKGLVPYKRELFSDYLIDVLSDIVIEYLLVVRNMKIYMPPRQGYRCNSTYWTLNLNFNDTEIAFYYNYKKSWIHLIYFGSDCEESSTYIQKRNKSEVLQVLKDKFNEDDLEILFDAVHIFYEGLAHS